MVGLLDCNNFFVSCERVFNPALEGKAVVVLSNNDGCVVSRSNEAKMAGIPMGLPAFKIREYTNPANVVTLSSNYVLYRDLSERVMSIVAEEVSNLQIYSIDETFFSTPYSDETENYEFCKRLVAKIKQYVGIPVSIGVATSHTLAKVASHIAKKTRQKQGGVFVISEDTDTEPILRRTPINDVWGIGRRNSDKLVSYGVNTAYDFTMMPSTWVKSNFSINGLRTQLELKGEDCTPVSAITEGHQTLTTSRSFGSLITDRNSIAQAIASFASHCAERLRDQQSAAQMVSVFIRGDHHNERIPFYANSCDIRLPLASNDTAYIVKYALIAFNHIFKQGFAYRKAGVTLTQFVNESNIQLNLFNSENISKQRKLMKVIDKVNSCCGKGTIILGAEGGSKQWASRSEHVSKRQSNLHIYSGMVHFSSRDDSETKI